MSYYLEWNENDPHEVVIYDVVDPNRFVLRDKPFTTEEKAAHKALLEPMSPEERVAQLIKEVWTSKWQATELYDWFEANCPGYTAGPGKANRARIRFANLDHAMLFKLTWV